MKKFEKTNDVIHELQKLDYKLSEFQLKTPLEIIIFGGTAFLLRAKEPFRGTMDIDAIFNFELKNRQILALLHNHSVNQSIRFVMEIPPYEDFYPRCDKLNIPFANLRVLLPSPEDLVLSKLFSSRSSERDVTDLVESDLIEQCNLQKLTEMYEEYKGYTCLMPLRYNTLEDILELRKQRRGRS